MKTSLDILTEKLEGLLIRTHDAEEGFKKATEKTDHLGLKAYFKAKSEQRKEFAKELVEEIKALGGEYKKDTSLKSHAHRAWIDIKTLFSSNNAEAMLEAAITGEKKAIKDYEDAIYDSATPPSIVSILKGQLSKIQSGLNTIKTIENL
ncbi:PA2169 family four-helix-bundle protein [Wenyingzhuangia sp. chi5]|uniref:PA2169 family four-helix-bundle protein n=1 Tax=Wenyingzhuangia gilva TaxID=3057677 RepID=A0ABT8VR12_9FLAO|nr:PA2169 family four-helix-bundle protein [Wenyingzhuangia sp. chi5]MDO3694413.1 PA2169 family four-helix-bundle protein [Wenyingzhuangia sp. chi5]